MLFFSSTDVWLPASLLLKMLRWFGYKDCCKNKSRCTSSACFDFAGQVSDGGAGADGGQWRLDGGPLNIHSRAALPLKTLQELPMAPQIPDRLLPHSSPPAASPLACWVLLAPALPLATSVLCLCVSPGLLISLVFFSLPPSGRLWPPSLTWGVLL